MYFIYCNTCRVINPRRFATSLGDKVVAFASEKEAAHLLEWGGPKNKFKAVTSIISLEDMLASNPDALCDEIELVFFDSLDTVDRWRKDPCEFQYADCLIPYRKI